MEVFTLITRYSVEETVNVTGTAEPSKDTTIWIKDVNGKILHYDVFTSDITGDFNYEFVLDDRFVTGTYNAIIKQVNGSDATVFGVGKYPSSNIVALMEKTNFTLNSKAILSIVGPSSSKLSIKILDSNDSIKITDSTTTSSTGKSKYAIDLTDLTSGIYKAVVSSTNIQDVVKFSVGLEPGSGSISLIPLKENYEPGESILVLGSTGVDARITITLYDPNGVISSVTETFSDGSGNFSSDEIGVPISAKLGDWKITAHSRLDNDSSIIKVSLPAEMGITLTIDDIEFSPGETVTIKGMAQSSDGAFSYPWSIPNPIDIGTYTITVSDPENSTSIEIFIQ